MKKPLLLFMYCLLIQLPINLLPFLWIDVWYDNLSYIGNQLHHPFYLIFWSVSTALSLLITTCTIFQKEKIRMPTWPVYLSCFLMILSCLIPYSNGIFGWMDDFHVFAAVLGTSSYCFIWMYLGLCMYKTSAFLISKLLKQVLWIISAAFLVLCLAGHVNALCEMIFSGLIPLRLSFYLYKKKNSRS
jgi:hypothetical protein